MKGINFIEPLFHKVVSGSKTQTRRIMKPQPDFLSENFEFAKQNDGKIILPRYKLGETLYLKEPYRIIYPGENTFEIEWRYTGKISLYYYHLFDDNTEIKTWVEKRLKEQKKSVWCNKLFAPQFASKHFIGIAGVRAERLREISDEDCIREAMSVPGICPKITDERNFNFACNPSIVALQRIISCVEKSTCSPFCTCVVVSIISPVVWSNRSIEKESGIPRSNNSPANKSDRQ